MIIGTVSGSIRPIRSARCLAETVLLTVQTPQGPLAAADLTGAQPGDRVLLITGSAAARLAMDAPADAAVVAVFRENEK